MLTIVNSIIRPYHTLSVLFCLALAVMLAVTVIGRERRRKLGDKAAVLLGAGDSLSKVQKIVLLTITGISWCVLAAVLFVILRVPVLDLLKILVYLLGYLVLPGYLLARCIKKLPHASLLFALCVTCGMGLLFLVYLLGTVTGVMELVKFLPLALLLPAAFLLWRDFRSGRVERKLLRVDLPLMALTSALLAYVVISRAVVSSPTVSGSGTTFMDSLYVVANSAAMKNGLLQDSFLFPGFYLRYHSMTNIQQACVSLVTEISAAEVFLVYWPLIYLSAAIAAIHGLIVVLKNDCAGAGRMTTLVIFSQIFTFGNLFLFSNDGIADHLYMGTANLEAYLLRLPNGNDLAIPTILCAAAVCILYYRGVCGRGIAFVLTALLAGLCTGAKAAYTLCILGALVGTVLLLLLFKRKDADLKKALLMLLAAGLGFAAAYFILIYNPDQSQVSTVSLFDPYDPRSSLKFETAYEWVKAVLEEYLPWLHLSDTVLLLLLFPFSLFAILPYAMPAFFVGFAQKAARFKEVKAEEMLLYGTGLCALLAYYLVNIDGYSQAYFLLAGLCFIHILGQLWLEDHYVRLPYAAKLVVVLCLVCSLFSTAANMNNGAYEAARDVRSAKYQRYGTPEPTYNSITEYEYEAMCWLRDNSDPDSLIATDRLLTAPQGDRTMLEAIDDALYFYYPAYSERQFYLSGYSYSPRTEEMEQWIEQRLRTLERLYSENTRNRAQIMESNGITHLIVSRFTTPDLDLEKDTSVRCVYENRDIRIYVPA